jgi:hypothetical protein
MSTIHEQPARRIKSLTQGAATKDGAIIRFEVETTGGEKLLFDMPSKNVGTLITFLTGLALHAANRPNATPRQASPTTFEGPLIEVRRISCARGRTADEMVMVFDLGPFDLGVAIPTRELPAVRELLEHMESSQKSSGVTH